MSEPIKDGGPAFPAPFATFDARVHQRLPTLGYPGMTLRDYFAAAALTGILSMLTEKDLLAAPKDVHCAKGAYLIADAMIDERNKGV